MPIKLYTVIYNGETLSGKDPGEVREALSLLLNMAPADLESLSHGRPVVLLKDGDKDEAMSLKNALFKIGALAAVQSAVPRTPKSPEGPLTLLDMCMPESGENPCDQPETTISESPASNLPPVPAALAAAGKAALEQSTNDELEDPDYAAAILELAATAPRQVTEALGNGFRRWVKAAFGQTEEGGEEPDRMMQSIATGSFLGVCLALPAAMYGYISQSGLFFGMPAWRTAICMLIVAIVALASKRFGIKGFGITSVIGLTVILVLSGGKLSLGWLFMVLAGLTLFLGIGGVCGASLGAALGFLAWEWAEKRDHKNDDGDQVV